MKTIKAAFWIITLISAYGCRMVPFHTSAPTPERGDWMIKWLNNPTCLPPCWENIIPGETSITDSISLLQQVEEIDSQKIELIDSGFGSDVQWSFKSSIFGGAVSTIKDDPIIYLALVDSDGIVTIGEIESKYGAPQEVLVSRCMSGFCEVLLIYKNLYMGLEVATEHIRSGNSFIELQPNQVVFRVQFYSDQPDVTLPYTRGPSYPERSYPWKGYTYYP